MKYWPDPASIPESTQMTRKERLLIQEKENTQFEIEQGRFIKVLGYLLLGGGLISVIVIGPTYKRPTGEISEYSMILMAVVTLLLIWIFLIVPYQIISTKRRIIVDGSNFRIESNKAKYEIDTGFENLVWWRKDSITEAGDYLQLKFKSKRVDLSNLEFVNLSLLEQLLRAKYNHKNKSMR